MYIVKNESRSNDLKYVNYLTKENKIIFTDSLDKAKKYESKNEAEKVIEYRYYTSDVYKIIEI